MLRAWLVLLALAAPPQTEEVWAGHAIITGKRSVPIIGKVEAKTESYVLAKVVRTKDGFRIEQHSCAVELSNPLGVKLAMNPGAAEKLPPLVLEYSKRAADGRYYQAPITTGWDAEDVDGDGQPGMTVNVDAPLCGGRLFVGLKTKSLSRGTVAPDGIMRGEMRAEIRQHVLGTEGTCISILADDSEERATGTFAYVPTSTSATCRSFELSHWPVRAR